MTVTTRLYTAFFGQYVGSDAFGNRYYRRRAGTKGGTDARKKEKRWVIYKGIAEPSKVPAEWHGWLHYTIDAAPTRQPPAHYSWEKPHLPNLTGTQGAYFPPGHASQHSKRARSTADYEAWKP